MCSSKFRQVEVAEGSEPEIRTKVLIQDGGGGGPQPGARDRLRGGLGRMWSLHHKD